MVEINIDPIMFETGSLTLSWHGLFSFVAVAMAVFLAARWGRRLGLIPYLLYSTAIWAIIGGIVSDM